MTIPVELLERNQWVLWKESDRDSKKTKVPFQPNGQLASSTNPSTWNAINSCKAVANNYSGIGFVFSVEDNLIGIDLDGCRDPATGTLALWADEIIDQTQTYAEVSPSKTGVKLFGIVTSKWTGKNKKPMEGEPINGKQPAIEIYQSGRYFTVTGESVGPFRDVVNIDAPLFLIAQKYGLTQDVVSYSGLFTAETSVEERAAKYIAKMPIAISGQSGSNAAFSVACVLCKGFALDEDKAYSLFIAEFNPRCVPPWSDQEVRHKIRSAIKQPGSVGYLSDAQPEQWSRIPIPSNYKEHRSEDQNDRLDLVDRRTDNANATAFVYSNGRHIRYCPAWKKWLVWDGKRWLIDEDQSSVTQLGREYAASLWPQLGKISPHLGKMFKDVASFVRATNQSNGIESFLHLARCDQGICIRHDQLNTNPLVLNVKNGTLDLTTGQLKTHNPDDHLTQLANVSFNPTAQCPKWLSTLSLVFNDDAELIRYCQQLLGYSISGQAGEAILPICYGSGANGKSTVWNTMVELLGDYGFVAPSKLLLGSLNEHSTDVASLYQRRFVAISEPEQDSKLREARVKELTGDSTITARRMREDFWSFQRTHKFWLSSNHLPQIQGQDEGIWRRVKLIPFSVDLRNKVEEIVDFHKVLVSDEGPGILNWLLAGYQDYRLNRFIEPQVVKNATGGYRSESDQLGQFIAEVCTVDPSSVVRSNVVFRAYQDWGGKLSQTKFGSDMSLRFKKEIRTFGPDRNKTVFEGICLQINE